MSTVHAAQGRPWLAGAVGVVLVALALVAIPIPYQRLAGHRVSFEVSNAGADQAGRIARELRSALGVEQVSVRPDPRNGAAVRVEAVVPSGRAGDAGAVAKAFAGELRARGYAVTAHESPAFEKVSGNVYAFARDRTIRVRSTGKSAAQIEAEIRQKLREAGLPNATVSVTEPVPGKHEVRVENRRLPGAPVDPNAGGLKLELAKDGQAPAATEQGVQIQASKVKTASGVTLRFDLKVNGQPRVVEIPGSDAMSDAALAEAIRTELAKLGVTDLVVGVQDGRLQIEKR